MGKAVAARFVPTIAMPRLDNSYGLLALIVGRGFHGLVGLLPLILGAGLGVLLARYQSGELGSASRLSLQAIPLVLLAVVVVGLVFVPFNRPLLKKRPFGKVCAYPCRNAQSRLLPPTR